MTVSSLTITITSQRIVDGWVEAGIRNDRTPEDMAAEFLMQQGRSYADLFGIGAMTSAAFIARFTPAEIAAILASEDPQVRELLDQLLASPMVVVDHPVLEPGLQYLVGVGLLEPERAAELLAYERPVPEVQG